MNADVVHIYETEVSENNYLERARTNPNTYVQIVE
jgi:hypothetical protein